MPSPVKYQRAFNKWVGEFTSAAVADRYRELLRPIQHLDLVCTAKNSMEATIWLVCAVTTYREMDGQDCEIFLKQQHYRPIGDGENEYCLLFDLSGTEGNYFGRIVTDADFSTVDLEDLFGFGWPMSNTEGFSEIYVTRLDGRRIGKRELRRLYKLVAADMYYEHSKEELAVDVSSTDFMDTALIYAVETDLS